jgi:hypothetical protein
MVKVILGCGLAMLVAAGVPTDTQAQLRDFESSVRFVGGYSASIPKEVLGVCVLITRPTGVGLYLDVKTSAPVIYVSDDFYDDISVSQAEASGDRLLDENDSWISAHVGVTWTWSARVAAYMAAGYSVNTAFRQYYDESHVLGEEGRYWVEEGDSGHVSLMVGYLVNVGEAWGLQVGAEALPLGLTLGVFWVL